MLKIDGVEHNYVKAINALNFDKLGHPNGDGSWGILFSITDNFVDTLQVYIGLKFDTVSISSSRFIATWFNMKNEHKDLIGAIRNRTDMDFSQDDTSVYDINAAPDDHFYTTYLDIHKIEIDVVELAKTIYGKQAHVNEYSNIARYKVFKTGAIRSARAISAQMLRQYEGNLETFSHIFTGDSRASVINGLIFDDNIISDEIKYTIWLTPHDLEDSLFYQNGDVAYEAGDEYIEGIGGGHILGDVMTPLFTSDRRGFRNGYLDISAENPIVNHGYSNGSISIFDTYMWGDGGISTPHRHSSIIPLDATYYNGCPKRLSSLTVSPGDIIIQAIDEAQNELIKITLIETLVGAEGERKAVINSFIQNSFIDEILDAIGDPVKVSGSSVYVQQCRDYMKDTLVVPICLYNNLYSLTSINTNDIQDSVLLIHHPVLGKTIFFDSDVADIVELNSSNLIFRVDGLEYGYRVDGNHGEFYWAGVTKPFRYNDNKWMNLKGIIYNKGETPIVPPLAPPSEELAYLTDSLVSVFEDLEYNGDYATIMAVRKNDFIDIIKKKVGVVSSDYVFGIPGGNINIPRSSIWM